MLDGMFTAGLGLTIGSLAGMIRVTRKMPGPIVLKALTGAGLVKKDGKKVHHIRIRKTVTRNKYVRLHLALPDGFSSEDVKKRETLLSEALGRDVEVGYHPMRGVYVDVFFEKIPEDIPYVPEKRHDLKVPIGVDRRGQTIYYDFDGGFPHLLIGGCSGAGKSVLLRLILTHLSIGTQPDFYLADMKSGIELGLFRDLAHTKHFATNLPELKTMLTAVTKEMRRRYTIMREKGMREWNGQRAVIVLDELVHLYDSPKEPTDTRKLKISIKSLLAELSAQARAAGISLVLCTQRPDSKTVDGIIKTNIATAISFKTVNAIQSEIILDSPQSAYLPQIPGRAIIKQSDYKTVQCFNLTYEAAERLLEGVERRTEDDTDQNAFEVEGNCFIAGDAGLFDGGPDTPHTSPWW